MEENTVIAFRSPADFQEDPLTEVLQAGARKLLAQAIEAEVASFLEAYAALVDDAGRRRVVRNGYLPERAIQTGIGPVTLSPETEVIDFWHACEHLQTASDHAVAPGWFEKYREILRHDPRGVAKVIRALRHLRDADAAPDRAETERELAFFRKHRHRMRYHALKEEGIAIGSGVVEAANKTLVTQRMKRSGMRWRIVGGQAVLTFRALIKSGRFERAWKALISATDTPANDNISPRAAAMAIAA